MECFLGVGEWSTVVGAYTQRLSCPGSGCVFLHGSRGLLCVCVCALYSPIYMDPRIKTGKNIYICIYIHIVHVVGV